MANLRSSRAFKRQPEAQAQVCAWPGCDAEGVHRAPLSHQQLREYQYFCLEHIRDFNRSWNFFEGWQQDEIETFQQADLSWHRPTWKMGDREVKSQAFHNAFFSERIRDHFGFTHEEEEARRSGARRKEARADHAEGVEWRRAHGVLGLKPGAEGTEVKARFKAEVKLCHPDINGGDKEAEERLREVIWAYRHITGRDKA